MTPSRVNGTWSRRRRCSDGSARERAAPCAPSFAPWYSPSRFWFCWALLPQRKTSAAIRPARCQRRLHRRVLGRVYRRHPSATVNRRKAPCRRPCAKTRTPPDAGSWMTWAPFHRFAGIAERRGSGTVCGTLSSTLSDICAMPASASCRAPPASAACQRLTSLTSVSGRSLPAAVSVCHWPFSSSYSDVGLPGNALLLGGALGRGERGRMGAKRLGENVAGLVGPAFIVPDDSIRDVRH